MCKFYAKVIFLSLTALLYFTAGYGQPCLICYGGSYDGHASDVIAACSAPATIFAGGIYDGSSGNAVGACSMPSTFFAGGFYSGYAGNAVGGCAAPVTIVSGGDYSGSASAALGACAAPATIVSGGDYGGFSNAILSSCSPAVSVFLPGGSYGGFSDYTISPCLPPASILVGGAYDGNGSAFLYCEPLAVQNTTEETFIVNLYPNPAANEFSISFSESLPKGYIIINDVVGKEIIRENIYPHQQLYSFKTSDWAEGVYFLKIVSDDRKPEKELMVVKEGN